MRTKFPLVPREPDVTVYIVLDDFGSLGWAYVETDTAEADENTIVENVLTGQYSRPLRVVAFNTVEGWARDVTEDTAREVMERSKDHTLGKVARGFLQRVLGADAILQARIASTS